MGCAKATLVGEGLIQWKEQPRIVLTVLVCQQIFKNVHDHLYTEVYVTHSHFSLFSLDTGHKHSARVKEQRK